MDSLVTPFYLATISDVFGKTKNNFIIWKISLKNMICDCHGGLFLLRWPRIPHIEQKGKNKKL